MAGVAPGRVPWSQRWTKVSAAWMLPACGCPAASSRSRSSAAPGLGLGEPALQPGPQDPPHGGQPQVVGVADRGGQVGEPVGEGPGRVVGARPRAAGGCGPGRPGAPGRGRRSARRCRMTSAPMSRCSSRSSGPSRASTREHEHRGQHDGGVEAAGHGLGLVGQSLALGVAARRCGARGPGGPSARARARPSVGGRRPSASSSRSPGRGLGGGAAGRRPPKPSAARVNRSVRSSARASSAASRWRRSRAMNSPARSWASARSSRSSHASSRAGAAGAAEAVVHLDRPAQEPHRALERGLPPGLVGGGRGPSGSPRRAVSASAARRWWWAISAADHRRSGPVAERRVADAPVQVGGPVRAARRPGAPAGRRRG